MKFNINHYVTIKLTDYGAYIYHRFYDSLLLPYKPVSAYQEVQMQLWEVFNIFGDHCYNGANQLFVDNIIEFNEKETI